MANQHPSTFVQADPVDVYKFIEDDLLYACDILPYAKDDTYRSSNDYRFSKGAALGLLTKYMPLGLDIPYRTQANGKQLRKQHVS